MPLTPREVHEARFDMAPLGRRGYDRAEVDEFLARAERALLGVEPMTPIDVERVTFSRSSILGHGYDEEQVDKFLDRIEAELVARAEPPMPGPRESE